MEINEFNAYLNAEKLEFTFANDSFSEQRFPKDKHKCQQFHIVKLKPTSKYFRNLYDIYIGNDISEKTKEATLKTIYNKILKVHYELIFQSKYQIKQLFLCFQDLQNKRLIYYLFYLHQR